MRECGHRGWSGVLVAGCAGGRVYWRSGVLVCWWPGVLVVGVMSGAGPGISMEPRFLLLHLCVRPCLLGTR